jgi:hypothetical protein
MVETLTFATPIEKRAAKKEKREKERAKKTSLELR